jgi:uncharacterized membrane protein
MTLGRKDVEATGLTILVVLTFFATHQAWNVPLVGASHRWAAGVIAVLGIATCARGNPSRGFGTRILSVLGTFALVLAVLALWTGSLTPLSLLVLDVVLLWGAATLGHVQQGRHRPITI